MIDQRTIAAVRDGSAVPSIASELLVALEAMQSALEWPERLGMFCLYCGRFSSTQHCPECMQRISNMPILAAFMFNQQKALAEHGIERSE